MKLGLFYKHLCHYLINSFIKCLKSAFFSSGCGCGAGVSGDTEGCFLKVVGEGLWWLFPSCGLVLQDVIHLPKILTFLYKNLKTRANTSQTMAYSSSYRLSRQFQNVRRVADWQGSCRLLREFETVKKVRKIMIY